MAFSKKRRPKSRATNIFKIWLKWKEGSCYWIFLLTAEHFSVLLNCIEVYVQMNNHNIFLIQWWPSVRNAASSPWIFLWKKTHLILRGEIAVLIFFVCFWNVFLQMVFFILVLIYGYIIFVVEVYIVSTVVFLGKEGGVLDGGVLGGRVQGGSIAVVVIEGVFFFQSVFVS